MGPFCGMCRRFWGLIPGHAWHLGTKHACGAVLQDVLGGLGPGSRT